MIDADLISVPRKSFCAQKLYFTQKFREAKLLREIHAKVSRSETFA
jgi:hypothetical protein